MKRILFYFTFLYFSVAAARSTEFGNGGKGIVCPATNKVLFYDTYESVHRYGLSPALEDVDSSVCNIPELEGWSIFPPCLSKSAELAQKSLDKIKVYDPVFAEKLSNNIQRFVIEALFVDATLTATNDIGLSFVPQGCELQQLAVQHVQNFEEDFSYFVSAPLWAQLSVADKVALLMHEAVYKQALNINPQISSSEKVRYFSSQILSNSVLTREKYEKIKKILLEQN